MTTPRRTATPSSYQEWFALKYDQACQALNEATAYLERATLKLKYAAEERDQAQSWYDEVSERVEKMEAEGHLVEEDSDGKE
jgi:chromosome condensin MukBEF ATPase and DNA-binding subunit MukB